jgi:hypothetical protein
MSQEPSMTQTRLRKQRGAAALAVALVLLFSMTIVVFFVNRGMVFEQKASANQYRSTRAFEVAEAGLEWATAMLNNRALLNAQCLASGTVTNSFAARYAPRIGTAPNSDFNPPANARAGCRMAGDGSGLTCSCPTAGTAPSLDSSTDPSFTVLVTDEPSDTDAVRVTAWGCINQTAACSDTANSGGDATATASVTLKLRPILRAAPAAPLTTGGWAQVCGSFNISNLSVAANGYLVNSGGNTQIGNSTYESGPVPSPCGGGPGQTLTTIPGTPIAAAIAANDTSLSSISGNSDTMFAAFFGTTLAQYRASPSTCTITGGSDTDRGDNVVLAYNDSSRRCRDFWIDGNARFNGNVVLGSASEPVTIASSSNMDFNGTFDIYGVIFSDSANWNALGTGNSRVYGAVISRVNYQNNGNGSIAYDAGALSNILDRGRLVRVPGTWRDFQ